ncbi:hypothetical protein [Rubinisphaera sp. JC750]|uniref:hypothetical protein n=1 Tax=Rubinisphaera sp. JC750 TaxID=2898658 RepID=UPI001F2D07FE|nr:hypothetical protein [Rubinisphaera sp. JC750]
MPKHIDLREQRLQEWAEKYFVPVKEHSTNWHPTVLEEMALKDFAEQRRKSTVVQRTTAGCMTQLDVRQSQEIEWPQEQYVPLAPTETGRRIDRSHTELRGPKFLQPTPEPFLHTELYLG